MNLIGKIKLRFRKLLSIRDNQLMRNQWVERELAKIPKGQKLLDAGCGDQIYRKFCSHLDYKGQDFGEYDGKGSGDGLQRPHWEYGKLDYVGDIWTIDEEDSVFDVILCTEVMEHIPFPNETIKEFSRLLKPGGLLLMTAPFLSMPHMQPYYFYSGFSIDYYEYFFPLNNFEILAVECNGDAFEFVAQEALRTKQYINNTVQKTLYSIFLYGFLIPILKYFSSNNLGSNKVTVFGYHIKAKKYLKKI